MQERHAKEKISVFEITRKILKIKKERTNFKESMSSLSSWFCNPKYRALYTWWIYGGDNRAWIKKLTAVLSRPIDCECAIMCFGWKVSGGLHCML